MSWRIFATDTADPDLARLTDTQRSALTEDLFAWVDDGPPRHTSRTIADVELFEDIAPSGFRITYFVNDTEMYVAILRIRTI